MEQTQENQHSQLPLSPAYPSIDFGNTGSNQGAQGIFKGPVTINNNLSHLSMPVAVDTPTAVLWLFLERLQGLEYTSDLRFILGPGESEEALITDSPPIIQLNPAAFAPLHLDPTSYGQQLSAVLFADPRICDGFTYARQRAARARALLRLQICLAAEDDAGQSLLWELLSDPEGVPLALADRVLLSRGFSSGDLTPVNIRPKSNLQALVAIPTPDQQGLQSGQVLDVSAELGKIQEALSGIPTLALARSGDRQPASLEALSAALATTPDILVLIVRSEFRRGQPYLWLDAPGGGALRVAGDTLVDLIDRMPYRPRLVVLQSEPSDRLDSQPSLISLGALLAAAGINAVLTLQPPQNTNDSRLLATFFRELRRDGRADRALAVARRAERGRPDWWAATLLLRTSDGRLWSGEPSAHENAIEPPPPPTRPPDLLGMVGRVADLAALETQLKTRHRAILVGMPGMGKTTLAAALARRTTPPERIIWHRFSNGEGIETLVWLVAGVLAHQGQSGLWEMLQQDRRSGGRLPPVEVLISYMLQHITGQDYLLCLDDFHVVDDDPQIEQLIMRLLPELQRGSLRLLLTARRTPAFAQESDLTVVSGLSENDLDSLLAARNLVLEAQAVQALHRQTCGNPQLLMLAIDALRRGLHPEQLIKALLETDDIERYLLNEVDAGLSAEERALMQTIAVLLEDGGPRPAIEALLDSGVRRLLRGLSDRYLLLNQQTAMGKIYRLHAIVQMFYYDEIPKARRQELHHRAAGYYQHDANDPLRAAIHAERAGGYERAADLATTSLWQIVNAGQARALDTLLAKLSVQPLDQERWLTITIAHAQVVSLLRPGEQARTCYQAVLDRLAGQPGTPEHRVLAAQACRGIAELLEQQQKSEALAWLHQGFELLGDNNPVEQANLHRHTAALLTSTGDYDAAAAALSRCLALLPPDAHNVRANAVANLGVLACMRGALSQGQKHFSEALAIYRHTGQRYREVGILNNLANLQVLQGQWNDAVQSYDQAIQQAHELGLANQQMELRLNLGFLQTRLWEPERALATFESLRRAVVEYGSPENGTYLLINLADLYIRLERWVEAVAALDQAEQQAQELELRSQLPEIYRHRALIRLTQGDTATALDHAERALECSRVLGEPLAEGTCLRIWAQAMLAADRRVEALDALDQSTTLLADDPYEQACTQTVWGAALLPEDTAQARILLAAAQETFERLGARRDLALVCQYLSAEHDTAMDMQ
ncbi:MAG: hypothetical protein OHK0022_14920 [Roseiflexaceae bacterium]